MALLDLQGMEISGDQLSNHGSNLSLTGCNGKSSLSLIDCDF